VKQEEILGGPHQDQIFLPSHDHFGQRHLLAFLHGMPKQLIGLVAALPGSEIVGLLKVDRIDGG
jgi:hypothetical protein